MGLDIRQAMNGTSFKQRDTALSMEPNSSQKLTPQDNTEQSATIDALGDVEFSGNLTVREYVSFIREHGVTDDDIKAVQAAILTSGYVEWGCQVFNTIEVRFRMRPTWVEDIISETLDSSAGEEQKLSYLRFSNLLRVCNLAGSLLQYGDKRFKIETKDDFNSVKSFINNLPYPILVKLCDQLAIFDRVISVATSDWALKNFTQPRKDTV